MSNIDPKEFFELKQQVKKLSTIYYIPQFISLTDIAEDLGKSRQTLTHHVKTNYKEGFDYKIKNGRIVVNVNVLQNIRANYGK